ncbi:transcription factor E2F [Encephalitozoon hellem ATCC 50504]|uniref:E2F/DP transcription factor n=1 Tax=Encephalitozoon hellem TaxID=27973 RepID=A0A9Q9C376_ENCHE|nr:transcription factor E2F [Encephalitozoon hellem ATCC 50504]AFM97882.1 transcription factor E2F [Encephalitozoon hellem ATCC 50504]UTX42660.1 transcription factor E2F [Encephalitozoon hellem]WEL38117.1 E2F/DP transcription factor [Encephalitozoon hellem]|eukprot:XP_003886863.1 transcription factor E2F [Encephalitozoon hellem ATCC 50504]
MAKKSVSDRLSSTRSENSLYNLTRRFLKLIRMSPDRNISIHQASIELNVGKRRIYDITNVLEGLGLLSKWSVSNAKWIGGSIDRYILDDEEKENQKNAYFDPENLLKGDDLDETLSRLNEEISMLSQSEKNLANAYVTYSDLQSLPSLDGNLIFAVKAPSETTMEYPRYEKGFYKLKLSSEQGAISIFYVSDEKRD